MAEERIPTYIPGDTIAYSIYFICKVNISSVSAAFRNESTGDEIVLNGEAQMVEKPRVLGGRTHAAILYFDPEASDDPAEGRYRLARLEAKTYGGKSLDFTNPVEDAFRFEEEPEDVELPILARGVVSPATTFLYDKGHPNSPMPQ